MTPSEWLARAQLEANLARIPLEELDLLLERCAGWGRLDRLLGRIPSQPIDLNRIEALWQRRRKERIPLHYLLGSVVWRDLELVVTPDVLIPRPETEQLVEVALAWLAEHPASEPWVDLGTGSGAIAIALARQVPQMIVYAVDRSEAALAVARVNAQRCGVAERVLLRQGNWLEPLESWRGRIQGLVSNPPYIPSGLIEQLQPEVRDHEPRLALDGGPTGLTALEHLIQEGALYLRPAGLWLVEVMQGQAGEVAARLAEHGGYVRIRVHTDLAGIERLVSAETAC